MLRSFLGPWRLAGCVVLGLALGLSAVVKPSPQRPPERVYRRYAGRRCLEPGPVCPTSRFHGGELNTGGPLCYGLAGLCGSIGGASVSWKRWPEIAACRVVNKAGTRNRSRPSTLIQVYCFSNRSWSAANPLGGQSPRFHARQNHLAFRPNQHPQRSRCPRESSRSPAGNPKRGSSLRSSIYGQWRSAADMPYQIRARPAGQTPPVRLQSPSDSPSGTVAAGSCQTK